MWKLPIQSDETDNFSAEQADQSAGSSHDGSSPAAVLLLLNQFNVLFHFRDKAAVTRRYANIGLYRLSLHPLLRRVHRSGTEFTSTLTTPIFSSYGTTQQHESAELQDC